MALVIKRRVSLDFLGEDYKDCFLTFKSTPVGKFEELQAKMATFEDKPAGSITFILNLLKDNFIVGKSLDENDELSDVTKDDLDNLDPGSLVACFQIFTGGELDPKGVTSLTTASTTTSEAP